MCEPKSETKKARLYISVPVVHEMNAPTLIFQHAHDEGIRFTPELICTPETLRYPRGDRTLPYMEPDPSTQYESPLNSKTFNGGSPLDEMFDHEAFVRSCAMFSEQVHAMQMVNRKQWSGDKISVVQDWRRPLSPVATGYYESAAQKELSSHMRSNLTWQDEERSSLFRQKCRAMEMCFVGAVGIVPGCEVFALNSKMTQPSLCNEFADHTGEILDFHIRRSDDTEPPALSPGFCHRNTWMTHFMLSPYYVGQAPRPISLPDWSLLLTATRTDQDDLNLHVRIPATTTALAEKWIERLEQNGIFEDLGQIMEQHEQGEWTV